MPILFFVRSCVAIRYIKNSWHTIIEILLAKKARSIIFAIIPGAQPTLKGKPRTTFNCTA